MNNVNYDRQQCRSSIIKPTEYAIRLFELTKFNYFCVLELEDSVSSKATLACSNLPGTYVEEYLTTNAIRIDPVLCYLRQHNIPVRWQTIGKLSKLTPSQWEIMDNRLARFHDAYCFRLSDKNNVIVCFVSEENDISSFQPLLQEIGERMAMAILPPSKLQGKPVGNRRKAAVGSRAFRI